MVRRSGDRPAASTWRDHFHERLVAIEQFLDPGASASAAGPSSGSVRMPCDQAREDVHAVVERSELKMNNVIRLNGEAFLAQRAELDARITTMELASDFARQREKQVEVILNKALGACDDFRTLENSLCAMVEKRFDVLEASLAHNKALAEQMEGVATETEVRRVGRHCEVAHQRITALQKRSKVPGPPPGLGQGPLPGLGQGSTIQGPGGPGSSMDQPSHDDFDLFALMRRVDTIAQELHSLAVSVSIDRQQQEAASQADVGVEWRNADSVEWRIGVAQAAATALRGRSSSSRGRAGGATPSSRSSSRDSSAARSVTRAWHRALRGEPPDSGPEFGQLF